MTLFKNVCLALGAAAGLKLASIITGAQPAQVSYVPMPQLPVPQFPPQIGWRPPTEPVSPIIDREIDGWSPKVYGTGGLSDAEVHKDKGNVKLGCPECGTNFYVLNHPDWGKLVTYKQDVQFTHLEGRCPGFTCYYNRILCFDPAVLAEAMKADLDIVVRGSYVTADVRGVHRIVYDGLDTLTSPEQTKILGRALEGVTFAQEVEELIASLPGT
jgi:hypothetical protein